MPRTKPAPAPLHADRLRALVEADGRPQTEIAAALGWSKQELWQRLRGPNLTVGSASTILTAIPVTDHAGRRRPGRLADLD